MHNARFGKDNHTILEKIDKEQPDFIAITGDLVDSSRTDIDIAISLIEGLVKIAPCYYVTGNHEAWIKGQYQNLEKSLLSKGVTILHDEIVTVDKEGNQIQIAGLDDPDFMENEFT